MPPLSLERIAAYQPKPKDDRFNTAAAAGSSSNVGDLVSRLHDLDDDGHAIKLVRAAAICQQVSEPLEDKLGDRLPLRGKEIWNKVHHLIVDAAEGPGPRWVRTTGLESAWKVRTNDYIFFLVLSARRFAKTLTNRFVTTTLGCSGCAQIVVMTCQTLSTNLKDAWQRVFFLLIPCTIFLFPR